MVSQVKEEREVIFFIALYFLLCYLISGSLGKMVLAFPTLPFPAALTRVGPVKGGGRGFWLKVNGGH